MVLAGKKPPANAGDVGSIPESEGSPGVGNGNPLQYPCLEISMDRGAWQAAVPGATVVGHDGVHRREGGARRGMLLSFRCFSKLQTHLDVFPVARI